MSKKEELIEEMAVLGCARNPQAHTAEEHEEFAKKAKAEIERLTEEKWDLQDDLDNYHEMNRELEKRKQTRQWKEFRQEQLQKNMRD